jgi:hypothetical protein
MGKEIGRGVIEGVLLRTFGHVPPGAAWSGTFTLEECGPKTYRLKCLARFAGHDVGGLDVSFTLKKAEHPGPEQARAAALDQLVTRLLASQTSGGYPRFQVDRAEWLPADAEPPRQ